MVLHSTPATNSLSHSRNGGRAEALPPLLLDSNYFQILKPPVMNTSAAALKAQFDLHTRLFNNVLHEISDTDANTRKDENINHIKWIAGHLVNSRIAMINRVSGGTADEVYTAQFGRGNSLDVNASYPPIEEITGKWNETATTIGDQLTNMPEEVLISPAPFKAPIADETMRGALSFLLSHESYHIGQLSILRKLVGKEAMSYN
jgi:uncharacterized damage-inducible protein DinB